MLTNLPSNPNRACFVKGFAALTKRQKQVTELAIQGKTGEEIGAEIGIAYKTVRFHLTRIYKVLGVKSRVELILRTLA